MPGTGIRAGDIPVNKADALTDLLLLKLHPVPVHSATASVHSAGPLWKHLPFSSDNVCFSPTLQPLLERQLPTRAPCLGIASKTLGGPAMNRRPEYL